MSRLPETFEDLSGRASRIASRPRPLYSILAVLAGAAWPPLWLTLPIWPPSSWTPGLELDWRLAVLFIGLIAVSFGVWRIIEERRTAGRPTTRLGIVWRFMLFGGLIAAGLQIAGALLLTVLGWFEAGSVLQALGASETTLLIFGVAFLPVSIVVGVSYALWAGLCAAFIAYEARPVVKDRLGLAPSQEG